MVIKAEYDPEEGLIKDKYILYSRVDWYFLKELVKHASGLSEVMCLIINPKGINYQVRDQDNIAQVDMFLGKECFEEYRATSGFIGINAVEFRSLLKENGSELDILGFLIEPDRAYIIYKDEEIEIPTVKMEQPEKLVIAGKFATLLFPFEYFTSVINALYGENFEGVRVWTDVEIGISECGPVQISRFTDHFEITYTLAPYEKKPMKRMTRYLNAREDWLCI